MHQSRRKPAAVLVLSSLLSFSSDAQEYFDYQAATPCDPHVIAEMLPYFSKEFGNPHAQSHAYGERAFTALQKARQRIARLLGGRTGNWVFTSGATEANALAILGVMRAAAARAGKRKHLITCATEHKSVLESCKALVRQGFELTVLPVDAQGHLSLELLTRAIRPDTVLVSVMAANNEIGVLHPISQIAKICHSRGVLLHTDATQIVGKLPFSVESSGADLISLSGHKIYGPKGVGALYVAKKVIIEPLVHGGGQEHGLRPGTVPVPLCVGLAKALEIVLDNQQREALRLKKLQEIFLEELRSLSGWSLNGDAKERLPGNINIRLERVDVEDILSALPEYALAPGSACSSGEYASHVLEALDPEGERSPASLRISFGCETTEASVRRLAERLAVRVEILRRKKPYAGQRKCLVKKGKI